MVRAKLPDAYKGWADKTLDKKQLSSLMTKLALEDPDRYVQILQDLNQIGEDVVSMYGRDAALSYIDSVPSKETMALNQQMRALVDKVLDDESLTEEQKEQKIIDIGYKYTQKVQDAVFEDQDKRHTALASQINSGSRGNKTQLMQLMFGNMMMKDALSRDIPYLHMDPYIYGASPFSYWVAASSGRKVFYDVQAATGQAGYLGKQVTNVTHDVVIEKPDCGTTDTGVPFKASDSQNVGHVLLRPFHGHPAGSIVTPDMVAEADDDEEMVLRSPMTCKCRYGVCAKCNGLSENGKFPGVGSYVSLNSARSFVEKITQSGISSKHSGGVGGKKVIDPEGEDQPTGFKSIERMFMAPSNFPGGAVLAPVDGMVTSIKPAAQGGNYITVGTQTMYCSPERTFKVHVGDKVSAGDVLTNGVPNPAEVMKYKGVGAGRKYYVGKLGDIFDKAGFGVDRSNLESFTRAMLNKVRIGDDGYRDWLPGEYVSYSEVAADWKPRDNAVKTTVDKAANMYLEEPVLNYTIGTRITPDVARNLNKYGFKDVTVNSDPPPFNSEFMRPAQALQNDRNWLPRLAGERLRDGLFDAARRGITDSYDSPSYVDKIVAAPFK